MKNINLKLQLNIQLRETITNNGTEKRDSMIGERYKMNMVWWLSYIWLNLVDRLCECIVEST